MVHYIGLSERRLREGKAIARTHELPTTYPMLLSELKDRIRAARLKAALAVNQEMVLLYYSIGRDILEKQGKEKWGTSIIDRLSKDLRSEFPGNRGLSPTNLHYMKRLAEAYPDVSIFQQAAGKLPWMHHCVLLDKVKTQAQRLWYMEKTVECGWGRNVLVHQIEADAYHRHGKAITNFKSTLPEPHCDHAQQLTKDKYAFDFIDRSTEANERKFQRSLVENICSFILELGKGFAFMGSQYHVEYDGKDYYLDLLFYHARLHCYVIIELKTTEFKPEYAGKMNFYLSVIDDTLRRPPEDKPSIGLILCKENSTLTVQCALRDMGKPIGVAEYKYLPTSEELTARYHAALETAQQSDQEPGPKPKTRKQRK